MLSWIVSQEENVCVRKNDCCPKCGGDLVVRVADLDNGGKMYKEFCAHDGCNWRSEPLQHKCNADSRTNSTLQKWVDTVKDIGHNTCFICGTQEDIEAHHIVPVSHDVNLKYNKHNGICLCKKCHWKVHHKVNGEYDPN